MTKQKGFRRGKATARWLSLTIVLGLAPFGCKTTTGVIRTGPHLPDKEGKPIRVQRPPPPVRVQPIPLRRNKQCYYRDGAWIREGRDWTWQKGEWILPPPGCYYAPPQTTYEEFDVGTALVYRPGFWHPRAPTGKECGEPKECPAPQGS